jgi:hypothetical protein
MDHCLRSRHYVNVVVAGKHPAPQWLTMDAAESPSQWTSLAAAPEGARLRAGSEVASLNA